MDVAALDLGVSLEDRFGFLQRPVPDGGIDEGRSGISYQRYLSQGSALRALKSAYQRQAK